MRIIKLEEVQKNTKKFYEICSDIGILQRELDEMLAAIEKNSSDFEKGRISKDLFSYNECRMKKESANIIKKINVLVDSGSSLLDKIGKEIENQKIVEEVKKDKKAERIKEIKKMSTKKVKKRKKKTKKRQKKAVHVVEAQAPAAPEQNVQTGR